MRFGEDNEPSVLGLLDPPIMDILWITKAVFVLCIGFSSATQDTRRLGKLAKSPTLKRQLAIRELDVLRTRSLIGEYKEADDLKFSEVLTIHRMNQVLKTACTYTGKNTDGFMYR